MKNTILTLLTLWVLLATGVSATDAPLTYEEGISFEVKTIPIQHQGPNVVDVKIHFEYIPGLEDKEYPDFEPLQAMATQFLKDYPDNGDYWEVVIKKMSAAYLGKAPGLASVNIDLQVYPTKIVAYYHVIHCKASRAK